MTTFLFSYRMPKGFVPGRSDAVAAWTAWFEELGTSVSDRGNPVFESASLGNCGDDTSPLVTKDGRIGHREIAVAGVQIGVANSGRGDLDQHFV